MTTVYIQEYATPLDIVNRALQMLGQTRITTLDDDSKAASEVKFAYDKVRVAELQRNLWTFATRTTTIRANDTDARLVSFPAWDSGTIYSAGRIVTADGETWQTRLASTAQQPGATGSPWEIYFGPTTARPSSEISDTDTFYAGELVWVGSAAYVSLVNANAAAVADTASWTQLGSVTLSAASILWPIGQSSQSGRNIFFLPSGFLRLAPQDPKAGSVSYLGASSGNQYRDWEFDAKCLVTSDIGPIPFRFIADMADVLSFDAMFCEGLAARIAMATCEALTQSTEKFKMVAALYKTTMFEARLANSIVAGATEAAEDDFITCRR